MLSRKGVEVKDENQFMLHLAMEEFLSNEDNPS